LAWTDNTETVNATGDFGWTFTPSDTTAYNVITGNVNVVANPPTIIYTDDKGVELNESVVTIAHDNSTPGNVVTLTVDVKDLSTNQLLGIAIKDGSNADISTAVGLAETPDKIGKEFTFTMPASDVTVEVTVGAPKKIKINGTSEIDLKNGSIAKDSDGQDIEDNLAWSYFTNTLTMNGFNGKHIGMEGDMGEVTIFLIGQNTLTLNGGTFALDFSAASGKAPNVIIKGNNVASDKLTVESAMGFSGNLAGNFSKGFTLDNATFDLTFETASTGLIKAITGQTGSDVVLKNGGILNVSIERDVSTANNATGLNVTSLTIKDTAKATINVLDKQSTEGAILAGANTLTGNIYATPYVKKGYEISAVIVNGTGTFANPQEIEVKVKSGVDNIDITDIEVPAGGITGKVYTDDSFDTEALDPITFDGAGKAVVYVKTTKGSTDSYFKINITKDTL
ncbi:MAG: hypothetical protein M0P77_10570, partial [Firmicutes bacterium]|nr:hypothetical protein [Bacillota bacterium]